MRFDASDSWDNLTEAVLCSGAFYLRLAHWLINEYKIPSKHQNGGHPPVLADAAATALLAPIALPAVRAGHLVSRSRASRPLALFRALFGFPRTFPPLPTPLFAFFSTLESETGFIDSF